MNSIEVTLIPISAQVQLRNPIIRERYAQAPKTEITSYFLATRSGVEVAFVVIDLWPNGIGELVLYQLYVLPGERGQGIGTSVLRAVEDYAVSVGRSIVVLDPHPLEKGRTSDELAVWYSQRGYSPRVGSRLYEKYVAHHGDTRIGG